MNYQDAGDKKKALAAALSKEHEQEESAEAEEEVNYSSYSSLRK